MRPKPLDFDDSTLDRGSATPLHLQIERLLRRLVQRKEFQAGGLLPGEVELSRRLSVSRNTVRAAMAKLEAEGLLQRKRSVGTTVSQELPHSNLFEWYSFSAEMKKQGIAVQNLDLSLTRAVPSDDVMTRLKLPDAAPIWRLERTRGWDDKPVVLAISWLHPMLGIDGKEDFARPLYEVIRHLAGVTPHLSQETLSAVAASADEARKLKIKPKTPLLMRSRTIFDRKNRPFEQNYNLYLTDDYRLTFELGGSGTRNDPRRKS